MGDQPWAGIRVEEKIVVWLKAVKAATKAKSASAVIEILIKDAYPDIEDVAGEIDKSDEKRQQAIKRLMGKSNHG